MQNNLKAELIVRLKAKTIHELRQLGRALGVPHPADGKKEQLLDGIMAVASGIKDPELPNKRGAPPKSQEYDRQLAADILRCREICLSDSLTEEKQRPVEIFVANGDRSSLSYVDSGILERVEDKWFLRTTGCRENFSADVFVNEYFVKTYKLREGDFVTGQCERRNYDEMAGLASVVKINGLQPDAIVNRPDFDSFTPIYADKKLCLGNSVTGRAIDLFAPIGAGQRVLIASPHGCNQTKILKDITEGVVNNNKTVKTVIVLLDVSPEVAADFTKSFDGEDVFTSTYDAGTMAHIRTVNLALAYCKRQVELSQHVVLIIDDLTRLARAYNSCARQALAGLDYSAVDSIKKILASARNMENGTSLTIISALKYGSGDIVEESAYSALKNIFNAKITLSLPLSCERVYPPIDFAKTYSSFDTALLPENELKLVSELKKSENLKIIELFSKTSDNCQLYDILR